MDQTNKVYSNEDKEEGSTKIVNFMASGEGVLGQRRSHVSHILKIHNFFSSSKH